MGFKQKWKAVSTKYSEFETKQREAAKQRRERDKARLRQQVEIEKLKAQKRKHSQSSRPKQTGFGGGNDFFSMSGSGPSTPGSYYNDGGHPLVMAHSKTTKKKKRKPRSRQVTVRY